jgi:hypothetical protein
MPDMRTLTIVFIVVLAGIVLTVADKGDLIEATTVTISSDIDGAMTLTSDTVWRIAWASEIVVTGTLTIEPFTVLQLAGTLKIEDGGSIIGNNIRITSYDAFDVSAIGVAGEIDPTDFGLGIVMDNNQPGKLELIESRMENQHRCVVVLGEGDVQLVGNEFYCTDGLDIEKFYGDSPRGEISFNALNNEDTCMKLVDAGEQVSFHDNNLDCDVGVEMWNIDATDEADAFLPWFYNNFDNEQQFVIQTMQAAVQEIRVSYHNLDGFAFGNYWSNSPITHDDDTDGDGQSEVTFTSSVTVGGGPGDVDIVDDGSWVGPGGWNGQGPKVGIDCSSDSGSTSDREPYYAALADVQGSIRADVTFTPDIEGGAVVVGGGSVVGSRGPPTQNSVITEIWWDTGTGLGPQQKVVGPISEAITWTYQTPGPYIVTAQVKDNNNRQSLIPANPALGEAKRKVIILPEDFVPLADIEMEASVFSIQQTIFFDGLDSFSPNNDDGDDTDNGIVSYSWTVINEDTSGTVSLTDSELVSWTPNILGDFTIELTVTDEFDLTNTTTRTFQVVDEPPLAVIVVKEPVQDEILVSTFESEETPILTVAVEEGLAIFGEFSIDPDFNIVLYSFDFGDGTTVDSISGEQLDHAYEEPGTYIMFLTVTDEGGNSNTTSVIVEVRPVEEVVADRTATEYLLGPVLVGGLVALFSVVVWVYVWPKNYNFGDYQTYLVAGVAFAIILLVDWLVGPIDLGLGVIGW